MEETPSPQSTRTSQEEITVDVSYTTRPVIPAVRLETKQITMTRSPTSVPCIVTITGDADDTHSVGSGPLGEEGKMPTGPAAPPGDGGGTSLAPPSPGAQRKNSAHVMEFFEEQEKSLQEQFLALPRKPRKLRTPSPTSLRQSVGLDHLDNLVRLMEQLTCLRDENSKLRRRCAFLESTKYLLEAKTSLGDETPVTPPRRPRSTRPKSQLKKSYTDPESESRRRQTSESEIVVEIGEPVSDHTLKRPRPKPCAFQKRSFSTGSLEIPSEILGEDDEEVEEEPKHAARMASLLGTKSPQTKAKSSKKTRWSRVKRVLTGQKLYEDIGRSLREFGRTSYFRYSSGGGAGGDLSPSTPRISQNRSVDSGVSTSLDVDGQGMSSSVEGSSPSHLSRQEKEDYLCSEIWMGPPDWWDRYEAEKGSDVTPSAAEITTIVELKSIHDPQRYLRTGSLPRRQSSPSLTYKDDQSADGDQLDEDELAKLHRSSSYKENDGEIEAKDDRDSKHGDRESKKLYKTAWHRVKDIIHTRKDSLKKRKKEKGEAEGGRSEEPSEVDMEALLEEHLGGEHFGMGVISRSTPKTSPTSGRQRSSPVESDSPPSAAGSPTKVPSSPEHRYPSDMSSLMAGGLSHEFSKKLRDWEERKSKKISRAETEDVLRVDYPDLAAFPDQAAEVPRHDTEEIPNLGDPGEEAMGLATRQQPGFNIEELQRQLTDSFSRKMTEWERRKYRGSTKEVSPDPGRRASKSRKEDRQRSKKSREEKEKEKLERQREKEIQKVEREQMKLERDKIRIEKERLRALEREAKIEKMKGRLSQSDFDPSFRDPIIGPLAEYKVTADFAHKLHEWEVMKGLSHDISTAIYLEAQRRHLYELRSAPYVEVEPESEKAQGAKPPPLTLQPYWDSPENTSPLEKSSETSLGDDSSLTEERLTRSNLSSLERANEQLLEELKRKELEYNDIQEEVDKLNVKLARYKEQAQIMIHYKRQLSPPSSDQGDEARALNLSMSDLEERLVQLELFGEKLTVSMETAAIGKWTAIEGEENVNIQLTELVEQMKIMLAQASETEEMTLKSSALLHFEKLYRQAMQLQIQLNNLRLSHLERNKEIMDIKRQLLLQEVNNLLLQADIAQREIELLHYKEARHPTRLRRWNTFGGADVSSGTVRVEGDKPVPRLQLDTIPPGDKITEAEPPDKPSPSPTASISPAPFLPQPRLQPASSLAIHSTAAEQLPSPSHSRRGPAALTSLAPLHPLSLSARPKVARGSPTLVFKSSDIARMPEPSRASETPALTIPAAPVGPEKPRLSKTARVVEEDGDGYLPSPTSGADSDTARDVYIETRDSSQRTGDILIVSESVEEKSRLHQQMKPISHLEHRFTAESVTKDRSVERNDTHKVTADGDVMTATVISTAARSPETKTDVTEIDQSLSTPHGPPVSPLQLSDFPVTHSKEQGQEAPVVDETDNRLKRVKKLSVPKCHLPEVELLIPRRRIMPAPELLQESRRYRSGHSACATRIMQRYRIMSDGSRISQEKLDSHDKENISAQRPSSEGSPQGMELSLSLETVLASRAGATRTPSQAQPSSPSGQETWVIAPLKDRTNGGSRLGEGLQTPLPGSQARERTLSDSEVMSKIPTEAYQRLSLNLEVQAPGPETGAQPPGIVTTPPVSSTTTESTLKPDSTIRNGNHSSMPELPFSSRAQDAGFREEGARGVATTTTTAPLAQKTAVTGVESARGGIRARSKTVPGPSESPSASRLLSTASALPPRPRTSPKTSPKMAQAEGRAVTSPKLPRHGGRRKMGTIGVLCQQSMSFDLGVSLQIASQQGAAEGTTFGKKKKSDPKMTRPSSTSSEPEGEPSSPSPAPAEEDRRRHRGRLLDVSWLQKPIKFFKVSK